MISVLFSFAARSLFEFLLLALLFAFQLVKQVHVHFRLHLHCNKEEAPVMRNDNHAAQVAPEQLFKILQHITSVMCCNQTACSRRRDNQEHAGLDRHTLAVTIDKDAESKHNDQ
jgi:hypothetical protein